MAGHNEGLHFELTNLFSMFGRGRSFWDAKLDKSHPNWKYISHMAKEALKENPEFSSMNASAFVVWLLFNSKKPVSENLILKRMQEREITLNHPNISTLMIRMHVLSVVTNIPGRGYALNKKMLAVIEEVKPTI